MQDPNDQTLFQVKTKQVWGTAYVCVCVSYQDRVALPQQ